MLERQAHQIRSMLRQRRQLMKASWATRCGWPRPPAAIGQTKLALEAQAWITADKKRNRGDPGAVMRDQVALEGLQQIGVPYKWGGASPEPASTAPAW